MKSLFDTKMHGFYSAWTKGNSITNVKELINSHKLVKFHFSRVQKAFPLVDLKVLLSLPCPTSHGLLNYKHIRNAKMLRHQLDIEEASVCQKCPRKKECKDAFLISRQKPTLSEYMKYFHGLLNDPPADSYDLSSAVVLIDETSNILKQITEGKLEQEHELKVIDAGEGPIQAVKVKSTQEKPKVPSKLVWKPTEDEIKRKERICKIYLATKNAEKAEKRDMDQLLRKMQKETKLEKIEKIKARKRTFGKKNDGFKY